MNQPNENSIKTINEHQQTLYEGYEKKTRDIWITKYADVLEKVKTRTELNILDIGGASGYFALGLYDYFRDSKCKIILLDTVKYSTWEAFSNKIDFIQASANDIDTLFSENTFDLIFANHVYHHLVKKTWKETLEVMSDITQKIHKALKPNGYFCIMDNFYNGLVFDKISSKIIYTLTSCKIPLVVKLCKSLGASSSGVGVCFLSKKMWITLLTKNQFICYVTEKKDPYNISILKKIALCLKKVTLENVIICEKAL